MKWIVFPQRIGRSLFSNGLSALGALAITSCTANAQALFTYSFTDASTSSGLSSAGGTVTGATFSPFTAVGTPANPNASGRFSFTDWSLGATTGSDVFTGGINMEEYYEFSITPAEGFALNLDSLAFTVQRSSTGIRQYSVRSGLDSYASNLPASISSATTALSVVSAPQENIFQIADTATTATNGSTLTFGTEYDAISKAITFRFYGWNAEAKAGTFSIDNVAIFGSVAPNASPIYWDSNGASTGVGGSGNWGGDNWNSEAAGTGTPTAFDRAKKAVFGGTAGTVTIGSSGVTANAGLQFDTTGYVINSTGGTLTLGASVPRIGVPDAAQKATISAEITGTGGLMKTGAGTLVLSGNNSYTGTTEITEGTLEISGDKNLGATAAAINLNNGTLKTSGTVALNSGRALSGSGALEIASGSTLTIGGVVNAGILTLTGGGTLKLDGASATLTGLQFNAPTNVNGSAALSINGNLSASHTGGTSVISNALNLGSFTTTSGNRTITVSDPDAKLILNGPITLVAPFDNGQSTPIPNNNGRLHKLGTGTLELTGDNSNLFGIRLGTAASAVGSNQIPPVTGGILRISHKDALGKNTFQFNAGTVEIIQPLIGANAIKTPMTIGASSDIPAVITGSDVEFTGEVQLFRPSQKIQHTLVVNTNVLLSGAFNTPASTSGFSTGLTITGSGSLTLAAATNTISELITVDGTKVTLNGSLTASSGVLVKGGTLTGNGTVPFGSVTIGDGGEAEAVFAPGNGITVFKTGGLTLNSDAVFRLEINSALKLSDTVAVTGVVALGDGVARLEIVDLESAVLPTGTEFTIIDNEGLVPISGHFRGLIDGQRFAVGKNQFEIDYGSDVEASDVVLRVIPEPQVAASLLGAAAVLRWRRASRSRGIHALNCSRKR